MSARWKLVPTWPTADMNAAGANHVAANGDVEKGWAKSFVNHTFGAMIDTAPPASEDAVLTDGIADAIRNVAIEHGKEYSFREQARAVLAYLEGAQ